MGSLIWMFLLIGIFWVVMILPQRKQQKKRNEMLNALKKGDKVITVGGIHGEIIELDDEDIRLRIADKVEVRMAKSAVSRVKGE
ncbi:MAG TPA: preprotein translocase subunit YajC [Firmicutes bacterium]|nr:preprotein translocase subunit YajC [Bacillota bacterium]